MGAQMRKKDIERAVGKVQQLVQRLWEAQLANEGKEPVRNSRGFEMMDAAEMQITEEFYNRMKMEPDVQDLLEDLGIARDDYMDLFFILDADNVVPLISRSSSPGSSS